MISFSDLLTEATPYNYVEVQTAKRATAPDTWTFDNDTQTFMVKANSIRKGKLYSYRKDHKPSIFYVTTVNDNGTVNKKITRISKPLNVCSTFAAIISKELHENKKNNLVMFRVPASMGKVDAVSKIVQRYVKLSAPQFEVSGHLNVTGTAYSYVAITRKNTKESISDAFGVEADGIIVSDMSKVSEEISDKIADQIDMQIRKTMPAKIDITDVAGNADTPDKVIEYKAVNPTVHDLIRKGKDFKKLDVTKEVFFGEELSNPEKIKKTMPSAIISNVVDSYSFEMKPEMVVKMSNIKQKIDDMKIDMNDIINNNKIPEIQQDLVDMFSLTDSPKKAKMKADEIIGAMIYRTFDRIYSEDIKSRYMLYEGHVSPGNRSIVKSYCGMGYETINGFLLHGGSSTSTSLVRNLDTTFNDDGVYVDKDVVVYRSMRFPDYQFLEVANGKLFHFRTFVSTSLNPMTGMGFAGPSVKAFAGCVPVETIDDAEPMNQKIETGMIIREINKIPVIIPGIVSKHSHECEVILPRGTTIKIENVGIMTSDTSRKIISSIMNCCILGPNEITVNETVYDGDEFVKTGRLVEFTDFMHMSEAKTKKNTEETKFVNFANAFGRAMSVQDKMLTSKEKAELEKSSKKFCENAG